MMNNKAVVLISGGLDSATVLAMAKASGYNCYALTIDYGQRHRAELKAAQKIAETMGVVDYKVININLDLFGGSALTDKSIDVPDYKGDGKIPVTYVPARNTIFLGIALGWAEILKTTEIFTGTSAVDYSGYPDCRPEFIQAFEKVATLATKWGIEGQHFTIHTPLIRLSKAETILAGLKLNVDYGMTVTCYRANDNGEGCGHCDSCVLRKIGFMEAGVPDPTRYYEQHQ